MFKVRTLNEYGYSNVLEFESRKLAKRAFAEKQTDDYTLISLWENDKPLCYGEKINRKWYFSILD